MILSGIFEFFTIYGVMGLSFAIFFVTVGAERIDPAVKGTGPGFRILIIPGTVLLWPLLLVKWIIATKIIRDE